ncbi:Golgi transport complex subunit COG8 NDAI_0D03120 [Naumovozyma dairenensis CBS 421]|uniref:Conserved oligomeric Golgi complex subunit 8 n=1 Tax=Naumovozyma dairenensis (strain ATCC 10597 / BCRC 20456 / CBS 421 / NBRC 0211 / NRRL Y-12639) TaxID=1071378 RepID=G0WA15_NAUDC|nr:hypothetical protein NDAI_0D03120 [Naumovozyma dairenensis CBS 421]CCD24626.1 hypothetical protein NDAI_0D03120 [Naumovozyma dairenensis CBS 421]
MDVILNDLLDGSVDKLTNDEKEYCLTALRDILQSDNKSYDTYFSSRASSGTITEEIAEIDAEISNLERKMRDLLVSNKNAIVNEVLRNEDTKQLGSIRSDLEQLWELDNIVTNTKKLNSTGVQETTSDDLSIEELLGQSQSKKEDKDDEFHTALKKLRNRMSKAQEKNTVTGNLASVLDNLTNITDLMELPYLARTCIRTGHYQEAVMLYTHTNSLRVKYPDSTIIEEICQNVLKEINTTMLTGLVKLLSTSSTVNSMKKILKYLAAIPPFDVKESSAFLNVFLPVRYKFIQGEISAYSIGTDVSNDSLMEMMVKRKIEVLREHIYVSLNVFCKSFSFATEEINFPLIPQLSNIKDKNGNTLSTYNKPVATNPLMLQFVRQCLSFLLKELTAVDLKYKLSDSVCLQLVYCSFRLFDLNANFHKLFLNQVYESGLFKKEQLINAIKKRSELASVYSYGS